MLRVLLNFARVTESLVQIGSEKNTELIGIDANLLSEIYSDQELLHKVQVPSHRPLLKQCLFPLLQL